jgi:hypothetical protein
MATASLKAAHLSLRHSKIKIFTRLNFGGLMRFAIDTLDEAGNSRIYIGVPLGRSGDKLRVQLRNGEAELEIDRITDWFQIDQATSEERGELFY